MKLNGGRRVGNMPPPSSTIPPNCWGGKRVRMGRHVTTCRPVIVALHPPPLSTKTPGNDDTCRRSPSSSSPSPRLLSPFPFPSPSSILPHHPHLLLFPFGSDVAMVALDVGGVQRMGGGGDVALSLGVVGIVSGW